MPRRSTVNGLSLGADHACTLCGRLVYWRIERYTDGTERRWLVDAEWPTYRTHDCPPPVGTGGDGEPRPSGVSS